MQAFLEAAGLRAPNGIYRTPTAAIRLYLLPTKECSLSVNYGMVRTMDLKGLRSLVALSDRHSIAQVAEQMHLSSPAIHKQLKTLETELGVLLYERIGKQLQLTSGAEVLLPYAKELLAQHNSALTALQEWKGLKRGVVRIGTGPSALVLPSILKRFRHANPSVEVFVETGNTPALLEGLRGGSLDLALLVSADLVEKHDYCVEASWDFEMVLVSHLRHTLSHVRLADLKSYRFILFRKGSRMQEPIDRYFAAHGLAPKVVMRFDNSEFVRSMVRAGLGISMLPLWIVDRDVKERRLSMIRQVEPPLYSKIALVRRQSGYIPSPAQAFIETARNVELKHMPLLTRLH